MKKIQILAALMLVLTFACKNTGSEATAPAVDATSAAASETMMTADTMVAAQDTAIQK